MFSLIPLAASFGEFKPAVIERLCEYLIDGASDKRFAACSSRCSRSQAPFLVCNLNDSWRGVLAGQHQIPHTPDQWEPFRVSNQGILTRQLVGVIQIAWQGFTRKPTVLHFCFHQI